MNFRMIGQVVGRVLCIEAALMLLPMIAAVIYDESPVPFLITIGITGGIGLVMWRVRAKSGGITARDGFLIVGLSWIACRCSARSRLCSRAISRTTSTPCSRRSRV